MQAISGNIKTPGWLWMTALLFAAVNAVFIAFEVFYLVIIPVSMIFLYVAFTRMDILLLSIVFLAPLTVPLSHFIEGLGIDMYLPTEPLLAFLLLIYVLRYLKGNRVDMRILRHPVTLSVYFYLAWMAITIITSSDPLVSFKYFISRVWFIVGFYILATELFKQEKKMHTYVWMYVISFSIVIAYTLIRHSAYGLDNQVMAHSMVKPFYKDHTSYGAVLAFLLPVLVGFFALAKGKFNSRFLLFLLTLLFFAAIVFSYTRAAWVGLVGAIAVWVVIRLRIRFEILAITGTVLLVLFFVFQSGIMMELKDNRQRSSGDIGEHVQSISNISTDQSNLERINRWSCALRMFQDRPLFGYGPGTYQFEYARFQRSFEKTQISTNFGNRGNAHSEYLGPLAEMGFFGLLSILLILVTTITTAIRVHINAKSRRIQIFSIAIFTGLVTYYIHGILNNFLDTDKISALFWGFTAILVAMDIFHKEKEDILN